MVRMLLAIFSVLILVTPSAAQTPSSRDDSRPGSTRFGTGGRILTTLRPIVNQVVDLLDDDVVFSSGDVTVWESEPIDTSQFNRIGIRVSGEANLFVECRTEWQFDAEDEYLEGGPRAFLGTNATLGDFGRVDYDTGTLGGRLDYPVGSTGLVGPGSNFGEVAGTRARIVCSIPVPIITIGDDPDVGQQDVGDDRSDPAATLSDVKVLLRRL